MLKGELHGARQARQHLEEKDQLLKHQEVWLEVLRLMR